MSDPLPDRVAEFDLTRLALAAERNLRLDLQAQILRGEKARAVEAQRALEAGIKERYSIGPADAIDGDTGAIVRKG